MFFNRIYFCVVAEFVELQLFNRFFGAFPNCHFCASFWQRIGHHTCEMLHCHGFDFQRMLDGTQLMGCGCYVSAAEDGNFR